MFSGELATLGGRLCANVAVGSGILIPVAGITVVDACCHVILCEDNGVPGGYLSGLLEAKGLPLETGRPTRLE